MMLKFYLLKEISYFLYLYFIIMYPEGHLLKENAEIGTTL